MDDYPRIVREVRVYAKGRIQIPSTALRMMNVKDGDRVLWIQISPGTFVVKPSEHGFRSFEPGA